MHRHHHRRVGARRRCGPRRGAGLSEPGRDHHQSLCTRRLRRNVVAAGRRWLGKTWKQPVIIEAKAGGGTTIGAGYIAEQQPDGYRLLYTAVAAHTISGSLFSGLKYHPVKSFTPISGVPRSPYLIVVNASSPIRTIGDLIANAKANPGKINYGSSAPAPARISPAKSSSRTGVDTVHVSFKGAAPANGRCWAANRLSGDGHFGAALVQAGKLRAIAVTSLERWPDLPDVPTLNETVIKGFDGTNRWR